MYYGENCPLSFVFDASNSVHIFYTCHMLKILLMSESLQTYCVNDIYSPCDSVRLGWIVIVQCCYFVTALVVFSQKCVCLSLIL